MSNTTAGLVCSHHHLYSALARGMPTPPRPPTTFVEILEHAELIAAFGDEQTAVVMYDTKTIPVPSAPGAECLTVENGKITRSRFVFNRAPFQAARENASSSSRSASPPNSKLVTAR